jgi:hypothetical protein
MRKIVISVLGTTLLVSVVLLFINITFNVVDNIKRGPHPQYNVIKVDSCEYIVFKEENISAVHKADCAYHKRAKHCLFCHQ